MSDDHIYDDHVADDVVADEEEEEDDAKDEVNLLMTYEFESDSEDFDDEELFFLSELDEDIDEFLET